MHRSRSSNLPFVQLLLVLASASCTKGGGPCETPSDCERHQTCEPVRKECVALSEQGEWCITRDDCAGQLRCSGGFCRSGEEGSSCDSHDDCNSPFRCNTALRGTCAQGDEGQLCQTDSHCDDDLSCRYSVDPPRCERKAALGGGCIVSSDCADQPQGAVCNSGLVPSQCQWAGALGAPCEDDQDCDGRRLTVVCNRAFHPGRCSELSDADRPCASNRECKSGLVCGGQTVGALTCRPEPEF